jgi:hypothetical protein
MRSLKKTKLFVTLIGVVCLGGALLIVAPVHANSVRPTSGNVQPLASGGGCSAPSTDEFPIQACISDNNGTVQPDGYIRSGECPYTILIDLYDDTAGTHSEVYLNGFYVQCPHFSGGSQPGIQGHRYHTHVQACFRYPGCPHAGETQDSPELIG